MHSQAYGLSRFVLLLCAFLVCPASDAQDSIVREAQISALQNGDVKILNEIPELDQAIKYTKVWTVRAATRLQKTKPTVSRPSALLLGEFIDRGARKFVAEGAVNEQKAEGNLDRFIDEMQSIGAKEGNNIGEATYSKARSICPLWPFC